jgi:plasmid replication initiation protein
VVLGLAIGIPLLLRARRRRAWQDGLSAAEAEVAWLARSLLPELRATGSRDQVAGGWAVSSGRASAAEDSLTALIASAPDDVLGNRATALRDALRAAQADMAAVVLPGPDATLGPELDGVIAALEGALSQPAEP